MWMPHLLMSPALPATASISCWVRNQSSVTLMLLWVPNCRLGIHVESYSTCVAYLRPPTCLQHQVLCMLDTDYMLLVCFVGCFDLHTCVNSVTDQSSYGTPNLLHLWPACSIFQSAVHGIWLLPVQLDRAEKAGTAYPAVFIVFRML